MRALSSSDCLNLWELGAGLHPLDQALLLLGRALPDAPEDTLADLPLGRRNMALAQLRCVSFGRRLQGWTVCRRCGEKLEVEVDGQMLAGELTGQDQSQEEPIVIDGWSFRLPTTRDLAQVAQESDVRQACVHLLECCCLDIRNFPVRSDEELDHIGQMLAMADPLGETRLALRCPVCENEWEQDLDIVSFLWREIETRARRVLFEIHTLASVYGWTESDILALSERRRASYLEMAQS